jgi:hypothetical protein
MKRIDERRKMEDGRSLERRVTCPEICLQQL